MTKATLLIVIVIYLLPAVAWAADVTGRWDFYCNGFRDEFDAMRVELKAEDGSRVSGRLNDLTLQGALEGERLFLAVQHPDGREWGRLAGRLQGNELAGTVRRGEVEFRWRAYRLQRFPARGPAGEASDRPAGRGWAGLFRSHHSQNSSPKRPG